MDDVVVHWSHTVGLPDMAKARTSVWPGHWIHQRGWREVGRAGTRPATGVQPPYFWSHRSRWSV